MIQVTPQIAKDHPKAFALARRDKMRVVWLEDDLVYVARRKRGHGQYLVKFFAVQGIDGETQVRMRCNSITGERCKGTEFGEEMCAHMAVVCLRGKNKKSRKQSKAA